MSRRQKLHKLKLGVVGVLKLIDQDVAEAGLTVPKRRRVGPKQLQGQGDLVAEVDAAGLGLELAVGRVGAGKLGLAPGLLGDGLVLGVRGALALKALCIGEVFGGRNVFVAAAAEEGH